MRTRRTLIKRSASILGFELDSALTELLEASR